jgi:MoaA/NifB/PqqE/SkfB family radical SAM enzyme
MNLNQLTKSTYRAARSFLDRNYPIFAHLFVTKRCNLRCKMCNVWETKCPEADTGRMKQIIDRLDDMGIAILQITGGEPFLRSDFGELVRHATGRGLIVVTSTNGTLPVSIYQKALDLPLHEIGVSLHSHKASTHDAINGMPGSWEKAVRTIRFFKEHGISVYVVSVISPVNIAETLDIVRFCTSELGVKVGLQPAVIGTDGDEYVFRGKNPGLGAGLDMKTIEEVVRQIPLGNVQRTRYFVNNAFKVLAGAEPAWNCEAGRLFLAVMPDGQLGLCQDVLTRYNVLDDDFMTQYHSREFRQSCQKISLKCKHCVYSCYYDLHNIFCNPLEGLDLWLRGRGLVARS